MDAAEAIKLVEELDIPDEEKNALLGRIGTEGLTDEVKTELTRVLDGEIKLTDEAIELYGEAKTVLQEQDEEMETAVAQAEAGVDAAVKEGELELAGLEEEANAAPTDEPATSDTTPSPSTGSTWQKVEPPVADPSAPAPTPTA